MILVLHVISELGQDTQNVSGYLFVYSFIHSLIQIYVERKCVIKYSSIMTLLLFSICLAAAESDTNARIQ